jgi:hypothetical protein
MGPFKLRNPRDRGACSLLYLLRVVFGNGGISGQNPNPGKWRKFMTEELDREVPEESYPTEERVAVAAYYKWQNRGCPPGDSLTDWVEAHREWIQASR